MKTKNIIPILFFLFLQLCIQAKNRSLLTTGTIYLDLSQASVGSGYVDIPVYYESTDFVEALDFALQFDESKLSYNSIVDTVSYIHYLANYSPSDKTLRFTSYDFDGLGYQPGTRILSVRFNVLNPAIVNTDFFSLKGLLNGDPVPMKSIGAINQSHHYVIDTTTGICSDPLFCLPVRAMDTVKNVIGYDFSLNYPKAKVLPTGNITIAGDLINPNYASYASHTDTVNGVIHISVFLNPTAPSNTFFQGIGKLLCVEFSKKPALAPVDTISFTVPSIQESYVNGVEGKFVKVGFYINKKSTYYHSLLKFWSDNSPIAYDSLNPSHYLITKIFGTDSSCVNLYPVNVVYPDLTGHFTYDLINGPFIRINRDILSSTDVQPVINGFDANLGHKVLVDDLSFIPSIYQIIALDVNMDGIVSAGDISQLNQRSVKTLPEFKQAWNYTNSGTSNGQPSKDWLFVDSVLLLKPAYKISTTYPSNDGVGYSKAKVPVVPFCLPVLPPSSDGCPVYNSSSYTGILLGDVNGNYDAIAPDGVIKRLNDAAGKIYLNLNKAVCGHGYTDIPISFSSPEKIVALDFAVQLNPGKLRFDRLIGTASYLTDAMTNYANDDHTLRFTSNSRQVYDDKDVAYIRFATVEKFDPAFLTGMIGYLNGEPVRMEIKGELPTGISSSAISHFIQVYPNPGNTVINVISQEKARIELLDLQGRQVLISVSASGGEITELNTSGIAEGSYLLKVYNDHFVGTERIVIDKTK